MKRAVILLLALALGGCLTSNSDDDVPDTRDLPSGQVFDDRGRPMVPVVCRMIVDEGGGTVYPNLPPKVVWIVPEDWGDAR